MSKSKPQQYSAERTEQLLHAAAEGDSTLVEALLGAGAFINGTNYNLQTPLIRAAFFGHVDVVRVLLDHGADADSKDRLGLNALDWATKRGFPEVARMLPATSAAMATTLDGTPQPDLSGVTLPDAGQAEVATPPSQSEDTEVRLDGEPTQPLLHLSAFAREMERRHEKSVEGPAPLREDLSATLVEGPPTLEDARFEAPPPYEDQPTLEDARTFDDPPTVPLSELPTQMLGDPPTRPLDKFATQLLDGPPTGSLEEFAPQTLPESSTRPLKGIPPAPKPRVSDQLPPPPRSLTPEPSTTTAPLSEGATITESASTSTAERGTRPGRPVTWLVLAIIAVAGIVAAYLMYSRRQVQPVAETTVASKATVPQGAFAGSEVSLQLGKGQQASSTETVTANSGTSNVTLGPDSYPRVTGTLKGSEVSLPDLVTPPSARSRWRRGLINVAVKVGSDGKVVSARALNGPSIWRQAAKDAAQKAQFKPQSEAALRSGTITYHFGPLGQS